MDLTLSKYGIINNRYRIISNVKQHRLYKIFKAVDIKNNYSCVKLFIIDGQNISKNIMDFFFDYFENIESINANNMINVLDFGVIKRNQVKKTAVGDYFYTTEFVESTSTLLSVIHDLPEENIIDLFINLCRIVNYFSQIGKAYTSINPENIFIMEDYKKDSLSNIGKYIKFKDKVTVEIEKNEFGYDLDFINLFVPPEGYERNNENALIYSLAVNLLVIILKSKGKFMGSKQITNYINDINNNNDKKVRTIIGDNYYKILCGMLKYDFENRDKKIRHIILKVNKVFNKNYEVYDVNKLEKLNFDTKIIGREQDAAMVLETREDIFKYSRGKKVITVHGETGIGKSRFLKYLRYIISLKGDDVCSILNLNKASDNGIKNVLSSILAQAIAFAKKDLINEYKYDLIPFVPELLNNKEEEQKSVFIENGKERYKTISRLSSFICEVFKDNQGLIIIDDIHKADEFTLDFLCYFIAKNYKDLKVMIIFSYCDGECLRNEKFMRFLCKIRENIRLEMFLKPLDLEQVKLMIKEILRKKHISSQFTQKILRYTAGNAAFIKETLKDLVLRKLIYIHDKKGTWYYDENIELALPKNIQEAYKNQVKELDKLSYNILNIISIFQTSIPINIIVRFNDFDKQEIDKSIDYLIKMGIICKKIQDSGFVFEFYNRFLKAYMYENMDCNLKQDFHIKACNIIYEYYEKDHNRYIDEIIYQLEKTNNIDELPYYYEENARILDNVRNKKESIDYLKKSLDIYASKINDDKVDVIRKIFELTTQIADDYLELGEKNEALIYYEKATAICTEQDWLKEQADIIFKIITIPSVKYDKRYMDSYLLRVENILSKVDYREGKIKYLNIKCSRLMNNQQYDQCYDACEEGLKLCGEDFIDLKLRLNNYIPNILMLQSKVDEAIKVLNAYLEEYTEKGYYRHINYIYNNLGVIYTDYRYEHEKALEYFNKCYDMSIQQGIIPQQVLALNNLGYCKYMLSCHEEAYRYLIKAKDMAKRYDEDDVFIDIYLADVLCELGNYVGAYKYLKSLKDSAVKEDIGQDVGQFYLLNANMEFIWGHIDDSIEYLDKTINIYMDSVTVFAYKAKILKETILAINSTDNRCIEAYNIIEIVKDMENMAFGIELLYNTALLFITYNKMEHAKLVYNYIKERQQDINGNNHNKGYVNLVDAILGDNQHINNFIKACEYCTDKNLEPVLSSIYMKIGDYYNSINPVYSMIYYFEACGIIMDITGQIPDEYKVDFINVKKNIEPFKKLINCIEKYDKRYVLEDNNYLSIKDINDIELLFHFVLNCNIIKNSKFMQIMKKNFNNINHNDITNISSFNELIRHFGIDELKNLKLVVDYICNITLSNKVAIIIENGSKLNMLVGSNHIRSDILDNPEVLNIINICRNSGGPKIIKREFMGNSKMSNISFQMNLIKNVLCVPIILCDTSNYSDEKRNVMYNSNCNIVAYIYIESDKMLNTIDEDSMKKCQGVNNIVGMLLEQHNIKVSSTIDELTGTLTRRSLEKSIERSIDNCNSSGNELSIIMFDIDKFKNINDTYGHRTGDIVLKKLCDTAKKSIRQSDIIGRYGGEEFIVILENTSIKNAENVALKMKKNIESANILGSDISLTVSLGISNYPNHTVYYDELIEKADQALYAAKNDGRNNYKVWNEKYALKGKTTNKLSGIITGRGNEDFRNISTIVEIIDILNDEISKEEKYIIIINKILEITDSDNIGLFLLEDNNVSKYYLGNNKNGTSLDCFNNNIIKTCVETQEKMYSIDWDNSIETEVKTIPDWDSIMLIPIKKYSQVKAVLYITVSCEKKEFNADELNFVDTLSKFICNII